MEVFWWEHHQNYGGIHGYSSFVPKPPNNHCHRNYPDVLACPHFDVVNPMLYWCPLGIPSGESLGRWRKSVYPSRLPSSAFVMLRTLETTMEDKEMVQNLLVSQKYGSLILNAPNISKYDQFFSLFGFHFCTIFGVAATQVAAAWWSLRNADGAWCSSCVAKIAAAGTGWRATRGSAFVNLGADWTRRIWHWNSYHM